MATALRTATAAHAGALTVLTLLWARLFFRHVGELGLYSDDWGHLQYATMVPLSRLLTSWPMDYRPFDVLPWLLLHLAVGRDLAWYYATLFSIGLATAGLLYALLARTTGSALLATGGAILWSVYPSEAAEFWLTGFAYRLGLFFLVLGLVLLVVPCRSGRAAYFGAIGCCVCSLLCVELYLGPLLLLPLAAALRARSGRLPRPLLAALPFLILMGSYGAYRVWIGPRVFHLPDGKAGLYSASLLSAATTEIGGALMLLVQGWQLAIDAGYRGIVAPYIASPFDARALITWTKTYSSGVTPLWWTLIEVYSVALFLVATTYVRRRRMTASWLAIRPGAIALITGLAAIFSGYLALALTSQAPSLSGIATRLDTAAVPGAACCLVGTVWTLAYWLPLPRPITRLLFLAPLGLLTALGWAHTERTASGYVEGWTVQRQLWRAFQDAVPALQPHTFVLIVGADATGDDTLASLQPWGLGSSLPLHYPGTDIGGDYLTSAEARSVCAGRRDSDVNGYLPQVTRWGYLPHGSPTPVTPRRIVVLRYRGAIRGQVMALRGSVSFGTGGCVLISHAERIEALSQNGISSSAWSGLAQAEHYGVARSASSAGDDLIR